MSRINKRCGVLAGGHWVVDHTKQISHWPEPTTLCNILSMVRSNGGAAYNLLCDLARLAPGLPLRGMGLVGNDLDGQSIFNECKELGISTRGLKVSKHAPTSFTDVMSEAKGGRRTFFHQAGSNALLGEELFNFTDASEKIFHLGYLGMLDRLDKLDKGGRNGASRVLERARRAGCITSADLVSAPNTALPDQVGACLPHLDILFANEWEAMRILNVRTRNASVGPDLACEFAAKLQRRGVKRCVIVHFPEGVVCADGTGQMIRQGSVRLPFRQIAGTAGAGDALAAGVLLGLHEDDTLEECLKLGVCAAAASLRDLSCSRGLVNARLCREIGKRHGFRTI